MPNSIKVPQMGESITEATVADWHVKPGDSFSSGDILVELETDKVTMEVPAPEDGVLKEIKQDSGATVQIDDELGLYEAGAASGGSKQGDSEAKAESSGSYSSAETSGDSGGSRPQDEGKASNDTVPPGARRLAEENGVDLSQVKGTGVRGQITKEDVQNFLDSQKSGAAASGGQSASANKGGQAEGRPAPSAAAKKREPGEREEIKPMSRLRQRIAERLVEAQQTAAMLTTFNEVDLQAVMDVRSKYKDKFKERYGVSLGFMSFFTKAVIAGLKDWPGVNAEIRGTNVVYKNYYDIGVAVGGPKGLVVPVVRDADQLSFAEVEMEIGRLAKKVQDGSIGLDELQGGTFTISNGGIYGSMMSTPILNPPQSGILGMHNIVKRAVVRGDEIVVRPMMYLALSYDHRIVDGKEAVSFLVRVKECIEDPERLLLEI